MSKLDPRNKPDFFGFAGGNDENGSSSRNLRSSFLGFLPFNIRINLAELLTGKSMISTRRAHNLKTERLLTGIVEMHIGYVQGEINKVATRQQQTRWNHRRDVMRSGRFHRDGRLGHGVSRIKNLFA